MSIVDRVRQAVDGAVALVAPGVALKRANARRAMELMAQAGNYRGARRDRTNSDWRPTSGSADATLLDDLPTLRERSRDLVRNNAIAASIVRVIVDNVVGTGIRPQSRVDADRLGISQAQAEDFQNTAESLWRAACKYLDASNRTDVYGLQGMIVRQLVVDGESFAIPVMLRDPNRPLETALDVIEADRCMTPFNMTEGPKLRAGVVLGAFGRPSSYWFADGHPDDYVGTGTMALKFRRVPLWAMSGRRQVLHTYVAKRPQQTRGEPMLSAVIDDIHALGEYEEATLVRARVEACFAGFVTSVDPYGGAITNATDADSNGDRIQELQPGRIEYLPEGKSITFSSPSSPGSTFDSYVVHLIRKIGAGIGLPLELILNDFSKTNYSSARAALLEARRFFRRIQAMVIERVMQPLYEAVLEEAWAKDELAAPTFLTQRDDWCATHWIAPAYGWIDPTKEVQASQLAIAANVSTLADECSGQGRDWQDVLAQRAREVAEMKRLGLVAEPAPQPGPTATVEVETTTDEPEPVATEETDG